jgi:hypothetical protein
MVLFIIRLPSGNQEIGGPRGGGAKRSPPSVSIKEVVVPNHPFMLEAIINFFIQPITISFIYMNAAIEVALPG